MLSGIYYIKFVANNNQVGEGLAVVKDGIVNGGDDTYLYQGRFDYYGDEIKAYIEVKHYKGPLNSVMGPLKQFSLSLTGSKLGEKFEVMGGMPNIPNMTISILGTKVAEYYE